jgi:hypothetical protein
MTQDEEKKSVDSRVDWMRTVLQSKSMVLHLETGVVGFPTRLYEPGEAKGVDGKPVDGWVVGLDSGDTFVLAEDAFALLDDRSARFYTVLVSALTAQLSEAARLARSLSMPAPMTARLVLSAVEAQQRALSR